jgi:PAS domain S-box-containing protein
MPILLHLWQLPARVVLNYAIAVVAVAAALTVGLMFEHFLQSSPHASLFLCAILFIAWACGTGPAIFATVLAIVAFEYFILEPAHSFAIMDKDVPRLAVFSVAAFFVVLLSAAQRRSAESLRYARDANLAIVEELRQVNARLRVENAERKQAEEKAGRAERQLQEAIDTIPILITGWNPEGKRAFVNAAWLRFSGISTAEALGTGSHVIVHPEDLQSGESKWREALATGEPLQIEQRLRRADGEYRWHFIERVPLRDDKGNVLKWYSSAYDIDDQKGAESALQLSQTQLMNAERELRLTLDTIPTLAWRTGPDGFAEYLNKPWLDYTGLSLEQALGWEWQTAIHPDDQAHLLSEWQRILVGGKPDEVEARMRRFDGEYRWFLFRPAPCYDESGKVVRWYGTNTDIEDRKQAESALQRSQAYLTEAQKLSRTGSIGYNVTTGEFFWSEETYEILGFDRTVEPTMDTAVERVHPEDRALVRHQIERATRRETNFDYEHRLVMPDGQIKHVHVVAHLVKSASGSEELLGALMDVTQAKQAEFDLQRSEAYLAEAQKLSLTGSFGWKMATGEIYWSEETYKIMEYEPTRSPSGEIIMQRTHPDDRAFVRGQFYRALHGETNLDYEHRLLMPDGQIKHLHVLAHVVRDASGADEMIGALMDVTQTRKAQEALQAAQAELAHASRVATLGEISASIAHEVNQPLAAIVANGQACLRFLNHESPDLNDVRGALEWVVKDGNRAAEVIQRVRTLVKKTDTQKVALDVNDAINDVVALLQRELSAHRVWLKLDLGADLPKVFADRVQLQQVVMNLIMNGAEAMQEIADRPRILTIRSSLQDGQQVAVAVKDCGVGLTADDQNRLFNAFFSTKPGGLGIGLSICRSIIEVHGGRLWASANPDHGATFQFVLPLAEACA